MAFNRAKKSALLMAAAVVSTGVVHADTLISSFTPGDLVVLRGGDSTVQQTSTKEQVAVYLDEFTLGGAYVGTIDVPSTGGSALTIPSVSDFQHQGVLNLSGNGQYLTFAGYQVAAGSADANQQSGADQAVIGEIGSTAASLTTNTVVNSYGTGSNGTTPASSGSANPYIRGAYTDNGTNFYTFGKFPIGVQNGNNSTGATLNGGLAYVAGTGPTATTTTVEGYADWRDVIAVNGQLYGGTGGAPTSISGTHGVFQIGTGEPTTNQGNLGTETTVVNQLISNYSGGASASAIALLDLPGNPNSVNGVNTLYSIGDQYTPAGIIKYSYEGPSVGWVADDANVGLNANGVQNPTGLVAYVDPSGANNVFLAVTGTNGIYTYVDTSGATGAIPSNAFSLVDTAPAGEDFYGAALAPGTTSVPEPTALSLLTVGAAGLLRRRGRRTV